jgi:E3 ubiquitin-protein ligase HECTD2
MFLYDEDSHYCYFNPNSLEPSEQFFLVGVVLGLAIYNSTILDVALPPFAFRKLLAAAPQPTTPTSRTSNPSPFQTEAIIKHNPTNPPPSSEPRHHPPPPPTLDDLAEYRPRLAHGLRQLLTYPGDDVETTFALDFALDSPRYGAIDRVPLCPGGLARPVTNANRREYVDAYVRYVLDTSVARQFEPFKRGFYTVVCSSSSSSSAAVGVGAVAPLLALFRPEEIELLVRGAGSDLRPLDVGALRGVAVYDGWDRGKDGKDKEKDREKEREMAEGEVTVRWFWEAWEGAEPRLQRRLLAFITGSDRVPAMGAASLGIRVSCLGEECGRFPTARTCFNSVGLWRVGGEGAAERERFEKVLWRAVGDSEGFGLK